MQDPQEVRIGAASAVVQQQTWNGLSQSKQQEQLPSMSAIGYTPTTRVQQMHGINRSPRRDATVLTTTAPIGEDEKCDGVTSMNVANPK
jgi:hypothetical protein